MNDSPNAEFSFLLWLLGLGVAVLAAHLSQAWVRVAQGRGGPLLRQWPALLLAAAVLGTGICSAMVLGMSAEALPFAIGYEYGPAARLWLAAMVASVPVVLILVRTTRAWALLCAGLLLAMVAGALQAGWISAAGFRPGVLWRREWVAAAATVLAVGLTTAVWLVHSQTGQDSQRRALWRASGALLTGVTVMAAQSVLMFAGGMHSQQGSVYKDELPSAVLCLVCGVLVPLVMAALSLDLQLRRRQRSQRNHKDFIPNKRQKRRHRVRRL